MPIPCHSYAFPDHNSIMIDPRPFVDILQEETEKALARMQAEKERKATEEANRRVSQAADGKATGHRKFLDEKPAVLEAAQRGESTHVVEVYRWNDPADTMDAFHKALMQELSDCFIAEGLTTDIVHSTQVYESPVSSLAPEQTIVNIMNLKLSW